MDRASGAERRGAAYAAVAAGVWSTAGILQAQLRSGIATQVAFRGVFGVFSLALLTLFMRRRHGRADVSFRFTWPATLVTALTAITSGTFIVALNETSVASVLLFFATGPIISGLLGARVLGERLVARTLIAAGLALSGVIVMVGSPTGGALLGDLFACMATLAFAIIIVVCAKHPEVSMLPAIWASQVLTVIVVLPFATPSELDLRELGYLALFGGGQMALGQAFFATAARLATVTQVAMISLLEIVLGPLWVWLAGDQSLRPAIFIGGALVVVGVLVQVLGDSRPPSHQPG